jgi:hypothetical protein
MRNLHKEIGMQGTFSRKMSQIGATLKVDAFESVADSIHPTFSNDLDDEESTLKIFACSAISAEVDIGRRSQIGAALEVDAFDSVAGSIQPLLPKDSDDEGCTIKI